MLYFCFLHRQSAYEMRISDWSSDVCSSDLVSDFRALCAVGEATERWLRREAVPSVPWQLMLRPDVGLGPRPGRRLLTPILFETNETEIAGLYKDRQRVGSGKREVERVDLGVRRIIKKKETSNKPLK